MTPTEALTRLAAAGRIRSAWLPGMRDERGNLALVVDKRGVSAWFPPPFDYEPLPSVRRRGDDYEAFGETPADDPATVGCLLALLREALDDPTICVVYDHDASPDRAWAAGRWEDDGFAYRGRPGPTEHAAILSALEAVAKVCP